MLSHVPVSGQAPTGNYYFEANPAFSTYPQAPRVRQALALSRSPVVLLSGHVHWNSVTQVNGMAHLTQQSLTESFTTGGAASGAWGELDLGADHIRWTVHGLDPISLTLPVSARRWTPPLAPFRQGRSKAEHPQRQV